ncbi:aldose 1-epimerase family protein [Pseudarthrobacter sp. NamE5]|uniref:aldose 1-epimerase family protein n=1 Tax=Pseudarthrobacter sp. NamE5 TaxID=2576839 RepID=UPI00110BCB78|nr:aldose 1-epimerase family protein [Pseudarthrobacter sp. NamE5]TLM83050.1 galactose mutarotase [Pseudarthrobacter sp. NamE5]
MNHQEYRIEGGGYTAVVLGFGATVRELTYQGRPLVVGFGSDEEMPNFRGAFVAPWPNRIADGRYTFDGANYQLAINEPDRGAALHGLVFDVPWTLVEHTGSTLTLACTIEPTEGYPFKLYLQARFSLDGQGFRTDVAACNVGARRAPYGVCPHPYLVGGPSPLEEWALELPASTVLTVTPDRLLPVAKESVAGTPFDFRSARTIGDVQIDHAFTDLAWDREGHAMVRVIDPALGTGTAMVWDASCPWVQIHTADLPRQPERTRLGLAVEPMSCPPEAFNTGEDLVVLEPGESHSTGWTIAAL